MQQQKRTDDGVWPLPITRPWDTYDVMIKRLDGCLGGSRINTKIQFLADARFS